MEADEHHMCRKTLIPQVLYVLQITCRMSSQSRGRSGSTEAAATSAASDTTKEKLAARNLLRS